MRGLLSGGAARKSAASSRDTKPRPTVLEESDGSVLQTVSIRNATSLLGTDYPESTTVLSNNERELSGAVCLDIG